jgi:hypothetical protein
MLVAGRSGVLDCSHHADQSCTFWPGGQAKKASAASGRAPRNIHISAIRSPSNR